MFVESEEVEGDTEVDGYGEDILSVDVGDVDADGASEGCAEEDGDTEVDGYAEEDGMGVEDSVGGIDVGDADVGDRDVGDADVGDADIGDADVGDADVGDAEVGDAEEGLNVDGPAVGSSDDGALVVGLSIRHELPFLEMRTLA